MRHVVPATCLRYMSPRFVMKYYRELARDISVGSAEENETYLAGGGSHIANYLRIHRNIVAGLLYFNFLVQHN